MVRVDASSLLAHRSELTQLKALADVDIRSLLAAVEGAEVAAIREVLKEALPELLSPYLAGAGELAAVLMEDIRAEASKRGVFYAESRAAALPEGRVDSLARWAVAPLADETLDSSVISRLSGATTRLIFDSSRDTITDNATRDGISHYQRVPRPNCCAFCGMLASRPTYMAYRSAASAGGVVGRGVVQSANFNEDGSQRLFGNRMAGGVNARGSQALGAGFHDDCKCLTVPVYPGTMMAEVARETRLSFEKKYQQSLTNDAGALLSDPKDILAEWRSYHGTK